MNQPKTRKTTKRHYVKKPDKKQPKSQLRFVVLVVLALLILMGLFIGYMTIFAKTSQPSQILDVQKGDTYHGILVQQKWQSSPFASNAITKLYLKMYANKELHVGKYQIPTNASLKQVVDILNAGVLVTTIKVQIIEGKTIKDLYHTLKNTDGVTLELLAPKTADYTWQDVAADNKAVAEALQIDKSKGGQGNLEGWFAPNTYLFDYGTSDRQILKRLYSEQKKLLQAEWDDKDANLPYQSPYEALIMASIIEKETSIDDERQKVAAVFINRLRQGMRLQTDPTIIYGLFDRYDGKIYRSNISEKTAYNTYQINGLPPTPIALPSAASIRAAMHPADTDVVYFVATGKGGHTFSRTLDEHNQAVAKYRATLKDNAK
ncbi:endolytic transglycosylase MltG [Moraxella nasovis]|uniref:endolytic transglycosylase MltG n=1 Tax=Moraxella nasovis TaxID=2904121 RepID=UPI001F61F7F4|nr:endolytic transglycosylase MltG [Moraxella nasovis]UNU74191.1 endolytic transglycosylase MltG [Moraxella nasovis]